MTFNFRNWLADRRTRVSGSSMFHPLVRRPTLVAHWQRGADGKLECRWQQLPD